MQIMSLSSIVGAPFELLIAISFLYQLLGWTALVGLSVMAVAIPLNQQLTKRRIKVCSPTSSTPSSSLSASPLLFTSSFSLPALATY
jgi:ABC-type protease/lipase transport system fused ATPase/permease subunit